MNSTPTNERPWKCSASAPASLILHLSNGKEIALAWFTVTHFQMDSLEKKSDRDPIVITIAVGRASYAVALFKESAKELFDDLARRKVEFIRPVHPVIEVGKVRSSQPEEG